MPGRTPISVGPQKVPALQLVTEYYPPYPIPDNVFEYVRTIVIDMGELEIFARYWPPKDRADRNTEMFYQLLKTLRWDR